MTKHIKAGFTDCWYTHEIRNSSSEVMFANDIALCSLNALAVLLNVSGNGFVVYVYLRSRSRQPISNTLLFLLAIFDLLQGVVSHPLFIATKILEIRKSFVCGLHVVGKNTSSVFAGFSFILTSFVLTSERLFAVVCPIRHRLFMRKCRMVTISLVVFVLWTTLFTSLLLVLRNEFAVQLTVLCFTTVGLTYSVVVYVKIYSIIRRRDSSVGFKKTIGSNFKRKDLTSDDRKLHHPGKRTEKPPRFSNAKELKNINRVNNDEEVSLSAREGIKLTHNQDGNEWDLKIPEIASLQNDVLETTGDSSEMQNCTPKSAFVKASDNKNVTSTLKVHSHFDPENPCESVKSHCKKNFEQVQSVIQNFCLTKREKKNILRILCIVGTMYITQIPVLFFFAYVGLHGVNIYFVKYFYPWAKTFGFISSFVNPFIYCYKNDHFWIHKSR